MAYKQQEIYRYLPQKLEANTFTYRLDLDSGKYEFSNWNTERDGSGTAYADKADVKFTDTSALTLYAIWKERDIVSCYENFTISAENVNYDQTSVIVDYSAYYVQKYKDSNVVKLKQLIEGVLTGSRFTTNGTYGTAVATQARKVLITCKLPVDESYVATTYITQYGYTPKYCINANFDEQFGSVTVYDSNNNVINPEKTDQTDIKKYSSTASGNMRIRAVPTSQYKFDEWEGGSILNATLIETSITPALLDWPTAKPLFLPKPLIENIIIGQQSPVIEFETKYYTTSTSWKNVLQYSTSNMQTRWYATSVLSSVIEQHQVTNTTFKKNEYYNPAVLHKKKYEITMPKSGTFSISGKYGTEIYGCSCCDSSAKFEVESYVYVDGTSTLFSVPVDVSTIATGVTFYILCTGMGISAGGNFSALYVDEYKRNVAKNIQQCASGTIISFTKIESLNTLYIRGTAYKSHRTGTKHFKVWTDWNNTCGFVIYKGSDIMQRFTTQIKKMSSSDFSCSFAVNKGDKVTIGLPFTSMTKNHVAIWIKEASVNDVT